MKFISLLVEGALDEAVGQRVVEYAGGKIADIYGKKGAGYIKNNISGFNQAAQGLPILVLADLMDTGFMCPVDVLEDWLPYPHENMIFRLVVKEIESWVMADRKRISRFLGVRKHRIPLNPEEIDDPKQCLINLARQSRFSRIQRLLVPAPYSTATEGPAYTSEMQKFVRERWSIEDAIRTSSSLARCVRAVDRYIAQENS